MNELHASGEFYRAHLTRFKCEHCAQPAAFLVDLWQPEWQVSLAACPGCVRKMKRQGWRDVVKEYLSKTTP